MTIRLSILSWLVTALVALAVSSRAYAQPGAPVAVRVDAPDSMYVGESGDLQIVITGTKNADAPDLSGLKDFDVVYRGPQDSSSTMTTWINGRVSTQSNITYAHVYSLAPRRRGHLEIPPLSVVADGHTYTTQPVFIDAIEPAKATDFKLELLAAPTTAYVGQPVLVQLHWTIAANIRSATLSLPVSGVDHELLPGPQMAKFSQGDRHFVQLTINGEPSVGRIENNILTVDRIIIPKKSGTLTVGPARADFLLVTGQRPSGPFDFPFGDRSITERQYSSAPDLTVQVEELPAIGRPANFSGLVGAYAIKARPDMTNVSVGDPINLTIGVIGPYPLSLVPAIDLARQSTLKGDFRVPREPVLSQVTPDAAMFQAMIRARSPNVKEIGPISVSYFDPEDKQYKLASTQPIPITVHGAANVTLPDQPDEEPVAAAPAAKTPGGLPDIARGPLSTGAPPFNIVRKLESPPILAAIITPPASCLLAFSGLALVRWRERDPAARRRRAAFPKLRRALRRSSPGQVDPVARALSNFAADSFDQPRDTLTGVQAAELLSQTKTPAGAELADILRSCDQTRFGADSVSETSVRDAPRSLTQQAIAAARTFVRQSRAARRAAA